MNRAERLARLHTLLRSGRPVPLARLTDEFETSRATVVRDLRYLRDFFNAPVVYSRPLNGYHYDPQADTFELPGFWLNETELYALLAAGRLLEQVQPGVLAPHLGPLTARLHAALGQSGHDAEAVADRVRVLPVTQRRVAAGRFTAVAHALFTGRVLTLSYDGRARGELTRRLVHPHRLVHYRDNWYLVAWCEFAGALRVFSLDRIKSVSPTGDPSRVTDPVEIDRFLEAGYGIFAGPLRGYALLRFSPERSRWVADEVWHPEQQGHWEGACYVLRLPYQDTRELAGEVMRHGAEVEVLEPPELRRDVAEAHRAAVRVYEKSGGWLTG